MKYALQIATQSVIPLLGLISGLYTYKKLDDFKRIIYYQIAFSLLTLLVSHLITNWQRAHGMPRNNQMFMNFAMLLDGTLLLWAAYKYNTIVQVKKITLFLLSTLFLFFIGFWILRDIGSYLYHVDLLACFFTTLIYSYILYQAFHCGDLPWWKNPDVYICIGVVIYSACSVPYIALFDYMQENYPEINLFLFKFMTLGLSNTRYLMVALAFWILQKTPNKNKT